MNTAAAPGALLDPQRLLDAAAAATGLDDFGPPDFREGLEVYCASLADQAKLNDLGAVALPCTEQLRAKDLRLRIDVTNPRLVIADERNRSELEAAGLDGRQDGRDRSTGCRC